MFNHIFSLLDVVCLIAWDKIVKKLSCRRTNPISLEEQISDEGLFTPSPAKNLREKHSPDSPMLTNMQEFEEK